jgi:hypothetical protein
VASAPAELGAHGVGVAGGVAQVGGLRVLGDGAGVVDTEPEVHEDLVESVLSEGEHLGVIPVMHRGHGGADEGDHTVGGAVACLASGQCLVKPDPLREAGLGVRYPYLGEQALYL